VVHQISEFKKVLYAKVYGKSLSILYENGLRPRSLRMHAWVVHSTKSPPFPCDTKSSPLAGENEKETTLFGMRWNSHEETVIYAFLRHADGRNRNRKAKRKERKRKRKKPRTLMDRMLSFGNNKE
jgi:hypothetical protein